MADFTLETLKEAVDECLGTEDATSLTPAKLDSEFGELGYDSLAVYEIATRLEDTLKISIPDYDIDEMKTPRSLIDYINRRLSEVAS